MAMSENLTSSAENGAHLSAPESATPIIDMQGVSKWFATFRALDDVHLQVAAGEKVVICGPSGSGKSTLIRCIARLENTSKARLWSTA